MHPKLKNDKYILKFISDYPKDQIPEKTYLHFVFCSIYLEQVFQIAYQSQQKRDVSAKETKDEKVELTEEISKEIDRIFSLSSKSACWSWYKVNQEEQCIYWK